MISTEAPKINPVRGALTGALAEILGLDRSCVNIKAKTAEGLGPVGTAACLDVQSVVLMTRA